MISRRGAHLLGVVLLASCAREPDIPIAKPSAPIVDVSPFRRIWIAGFVTTANRDIDVNFETVRLLRRRLNPRTALRVIEAEPLTIRDESELLDQERWKRLAEEYAEPLIVTGSVRLNPARPVAVERTAGRGSVYLSRKGFVLETTFVFIDGRTGDVMASAPLPKETLYGSDSRTSTMFLYFQLMDRVVPKFLRALGR